MISFEIRILSCHWYISTVWDLYCHIFFFIIPTHILSWGKGLDYRQAGACSPLLHSPIIGRCMKFGIVLLQYIHHWKRCWQVVALYHHRCCHSKFVMVKIWVVLYPEEQNYMFCLKMYVDASYLVSLIFLFLLNIRL